METTQEKRYWTHEEIGREAGSLCEVSSALQKAVDGIEALPSGSGELCGEATVTDGDLEALRGILKRAYRAYNYATDAAMQSYADYCEQEAAAIAAEWEERRA